jgi:hypothetical protein
MKANNNLASEEKFVLCLRRVGPEKQVRASETDAGSPIIGTKMKREKLLVVIPRLEK